MDNRNAEEQKGLGLTGQVLIWGGVLLLLVGGLMIYPYVRSRLATLPPAPTPTPAFLHPIAPLPTATSAAPTSTPSPLPTSDLPTPPTPTATVIPSPTPTPALPSSIVIPSISVDAPVVPVSWRTTEVNGQPQAVWEVPAMYAAGWHETSASLGVPGNTVLSGHNTGNGEVFRDLYTLEAGDTITVYAEDVAHTYGIDEILILPEAGQPLEVRLDNARYILPTEDERLTLVTCHPYGSLRYRLIVIARPTTADADEG